MKHIVFSHYPNGENSEPRVAAYPEDQVSVNHEERRIHIFSISQTINYVRLHKCEEEEVSDLMKFMLQQLGVEIEEETEEVVDEESDEEEEEE